MWTEAALQQTADFIPSAEARSFQGCSPFGDAILAGACATITYTPGGQQAITLNRRSFVVGQYVGGGLIERDTAIEALTAAGLRMVNTDPKKLWTAKEVRKKVSNAVRDGMKKPMDGEEPFRFMEEVHRRFFDDPQYQKDMEDLLLAEEAKRKAEPREEEPRKEESNHKAEQRQQEKPKEKSRAGNTEAKVNVSIDDFRAYLPQHNYIYLPTREPWPSASVDATLGKVGNQKASTWLDQNRAVVQATWAPGEPTLINDRIIAEGGWITQPQVTVLNLYRPPRRIEGNAAAAMRWVEHVQYIYPDVADHFINWFAARVQKPEEKINHGLVLGGLPGIGKDTLLEPVKHAVGPWNFGEVGPQRMLGRFNGYTKNVIIRVSEARDLGEINRYQFYEHMKAYLAAPPDVLRVDEKYLREHYVLNCCGVVLTTNYKTDGLYLPASDRRHCVGWSDRTPADLEKGYWDSLWSWYRDGGYGHVAAYLRELDISSFDLKAPPPKTAAFWAIVEANKAPEDGEFADALDVLGWPDAVTLEMIEQVPVVPGQFYEWLHDRKNRRAIPRRLESCGYVSIRNENAKDA